MPWHVERNGCPAGEPWAVIKDDDGSIAGCHPSESAADAQVAALYANEDKMSTRTTFPRPTAETLAVFDENKVKRKSDGRFDKKGGTGARPRGPGGFRPTKGQLQEDDVPATSPNGARIVDFAKGVAKYSDGSTLTAQGWRNVPAKNKARGNRFALPTTAVVAVPEGDEFKTTYHDPRSGRFTSPGRGSRSGGPPKMTRREPLPGERAKAGKAANAKEKKMAEQFRRPRLLAPKGVSGTNRRARRKPPPIPGRGT